MPLVALYCVSADRLCVAVTDQRLSADGTSPTVQFDRWVALYQLVSAVPGAPLPLLPEYIAKPWGQEIWYTGVEQRAVCNFGAGLGRVSHGGASDDQTPGGRTPIPWLQAVLPDDAAGTAGQPLVLLKILDPLPQAVAGDLYFELHEQKREVYVVTHVDESAWPDGVGYIRYGFDPGRRARSASDQVFRADYLAAVQAYEDVRRALDALPEGAKPSSAQLAQEQQLRNSMNGFTHMHPLRAGDVVVVPLLLPHALQHGVRTIEFQTPVYERKILSFAQRVLTQDHWDTGSVLAQMLLTPPMAEPFTGLIELDGVRVERIVDFPDFEVRRVRLEDGACLKVERINDYALVMVVEGELVLDGSHYSAEQALLLPRGWQDRLSPANPAQPLVLLLALPRR